MVVLAANNQLMARPPEIGSSVLTLTFKVDLMEIDYTLSAEQQFESVSAHAWNPSTRQMISEKAESPAIPNQGDVSGETLSGVVLPATINLVYC